MSAFTNIFNTLMTMLLFIVSSFNGGIKAAEVPQNPAQYDDTVMFVSDYQGTDRAANFKAILAATGEEKPGLIIGGGDYQSVFTGAAGSALGIYEMKRAVAERWDYDMESLCRQPPFSAYSVFIIPTSSGCLLKTYDCSALPASQRYYGFC